MIPVAGKPLILYGLESLVDAGIRKIGVVLGPIWREVKQLLGDGSRFDVEISYIMQPEPKGLAHALDISRDFLGTDPFVMYLGDNLLQDGLTPMISLFERSNVDCVIGLSKVDDPFRYGVAILDSNMNLLRLVEKPTLPVSSWALIGIYIFDDRIFEAIKKISPSQRGELEITDAIQVLLDQGQVKVYFVRGWWKDVGSPSDLTVAEKLLAEETSE